jgi:rRNA maturation RNase YbeY
MSVSIRNLGKKRIPSWIPFSNITDKVLGKKYELSLVFAGHALSRRLNRDLRGKDKPTNVLSLPLDKHNGEIIIDLMKVTEEAKKFDRNIGQHVLALFIHGALHLKGFSHGSTMERKEAQLYKAFSKNDEKHNHRTGYRNGVSARRSQRILKRK